MKAVGKTAHIKVLAGDYVETPVFDKASNCLLEGGYDTGYLSNSGKSSQIKGSLTIGNGTLEITNIVLGSPPK